MGFQSSLLGTVAAVDGAVGSIKSTLIKRQEQAN